MSSHMHEPSFRRDLGDGLVLRWSSSRADIEGIAQLYEVVFREKPENPLNVRMRYWAEDIASGRHPAAGPGDFAIVEDTRAGLIVAALVVLRQTWRYDGIPFEIGRPEAVASHPDYRNRGLVRGIFDLFHARSTARDQLVQGITGIGYFYRQFGYEYAVDLEGTRRIPFSTIPKLKEGEAEQIGLRGATLADLPLVRDLYERECHGTPGYAVKVSTTFDERWWRWVLDGQNPESGQGCNLQMIIDASGAPAGYVMAGRTRWGPSLPIFGVSVSAGVSLVNLAPSLLRRLQAVAETTAPWREGLPPAERLVFVLRGSHPFYDAISPDVITRAAEPYAWYVRVPDLPSFMRHIAPALDAQLAQTPAAGYTGEIKLDFYRDGLRLVFEAGRLVVAESWRRPVWGPGAQAGFPPLVFLQLLFGRRSLDDLRYAFPDVWADDEIQPVLQALFPKQRSWAIGQD